jgi:pimeloyl-ACP methyl ester carboxylesterase
MHMVLLGRRTIRYFGVGVLVVASALWMTSANAAPPTAGTAGTTRTEEHKECQDLTLRVALTAATAAQYRIVGTLCTPRRRATNTVQLLVHGSTYSRYVWDFPFQRERYSYVDYMTDAGYSTFSYDRIGDGQSSHPPSSLIDVYSDAFVLHQVIMALREGRLGRHAFTRVVTVGHSLGAAITDYEAATYQDVDAMIPTGIGFLQSPSGAAKANQFAYPANQDPKFAGRGLDDGYITTTPGARGPVYYYLPNADPRVVALDERLKQTRGSLELPTAYTELANGDTLKVSVPVLEVNGRYDIFSCSSFENAGDAADCTSADTFLQAEAPHWSPLACLHVAIILNAGHDINLQRNAPVWFAIARHWADTFVGPNGDARPTATDCTHGKAITRG